MKKKYDSQKKNLLLLLQAIYLKNALTAFQKTSKAEEIIRETIETEDNQNEFSRIRCPWCRWRPDAASRWQCWDCDFPEYFFGGCGAIWNTFQTRGRCPGCGHQWRWTSCLRCAGWARHEDWYEKDTET